jgi:hypothetical protein
MTRVSAGMRRCPNCGRDLAHPVGGAEESEPPVLAPARAPRAEGKRKAEPKAREPQAPRAPQASRAPAPAPAPKLPALTLDPVEVRALIAANPGWIERGLRLYEDRGRPVGAAFSTPVGTIDLLAQDDAAGLVVAMVAEGEPDKEMVLELLERIGFVRTQIAAEGQEVRGLLIVERLPDPVRYAIAALGDTMSVKTWRVALSFEELPV